jgi:integral membrane sensor domain MASE1
MKERNLLYFITALVASILLLVSILARTQSWYDLNNYGSIAVPTIHYLIIPVILFWLAWYFEDKGSLLSAAVILSVVFALHLDHSGILNNDPYVISRYAPAVKTAYVLTLMLSLGSVILAFFTYLQNDLKKLFKKTKEFQ